MSTIAPLLSLLHTPPPPPVIYKKELGGVARKQIDENVAKKRERERNIKIKPFILPGHEAVTHKSCSLSDEATVNEIALIDCINQP